MQIHVVKNGDSLWRIAQNYGTDSSQIASVNDLEDPDVLVVGQSLVIPEPGIDYVVQPGDTLRTVADRFGVTVQQLAAANQIADPSRIYAGQMLQTPFITHNVQAGDTIWALAQQYGVSVATILSVNRLSAPGLIFPGQTLIIPIAIRRPVIDTFAYASLVGSSTGKSDVLRLGRHLSYLGPSMYHFTEDGELVELEDQPVRQAAAETNTAPILVVANQGEEGGFDSELAADLLQDSDTQTQFMTNLLDELREKDYAGVNFDFEYINSEDRENYNAFLRRAVIRLHPEGFLVSTAVAPKQSGGQQGQLYGGVDYQAHGSICDFVILMTYEWGWSGGPPRAIAPVDEVRGVLDYAVRLIPRDKIFMGISLYGRDWKIPWEEGTRADTLNPQVLLERAVDYGTAIQYDDTSQAPFYRYTDDDGQRHEVWFEDARSMQAKYDTVSAYGIRGAAYWTLNFSFPQNWAVLQDNFRVRQW